MFNLRKKKKDKELKAKKEKLSIIDKRLVEVKKISLDKIKYSEDTIEHNKHLISSEKSLIESSRFNIIVTDIKRLTKEISDNSHMLGKKYLYTYFVTDDDIKEKKSLVEDKINLVGHLLDELLNINNLNFTSCMQRSFSHYGTNSPFSSIL